MTVAPTLQKGLKRLFSSSVLQIIASILLIVGLITTVVGLVAALANISGDATGGLAAAGIGATLTLIAGILAIIAAILSLVGIINVSKENDKFKIALYAVLGNIILVVIGLFLRQSSATVSTIINLLGNVCNIVMFLFVCDGINEVGKKLGRSDFLGRYNTIVIFYVLSAVLALIGGFMNPLSTMAYIFQIIGGLCSIISYFMYMGYLRKAIKAVEGVPTTMQQPQY